MNMEIILDGIILSLFGISLLICLILFILIFLSIRPLISNVSVILLLNIYISLFLTSIMMFIIYVYNLYGDLYPSISVNDSWCQFRGYLVNVGFCALYYSCLLNSIFRLVRIVFYKFKYLQSCAVFLNLIFLQWFISFMLILVNLFNGDYEYLPQQYRCWISFKNPRGLLIASIIIYICPSVTILLIYIYILRYVRRTNPVKPRQQKTIERDIIILKRIMIFIFTIILLGLPTVSILIIWVITGVLIPMAYHIQGLSMGMGIFVATLSFALISPQIKQIFNQKEQNISSPGTIRSYPETLQEGAEDFI